jgi:hypothetical protein
MSATKLVCCPGCHAHVSPIRPGLLARASVPFAWLYCALMVLGGGLTGPFLLVVTPFLVLAGSSMIRTAHEAAFRAPHCPRCEKVLVDEPEERAVIGRVPERVVG